MSPGHDHAARRARGQGHDPHAIVTHHHAAAPRRQGVSVRPRHGARVDHATDAR
jgi:hypothetical protein